MGSNKEGSIRDYHHPFTPYNIQLQFMNSVYDCIQQKQIGIFESPTGTGKSLSLICGSLTWLRDHEFDELNADIDQSYAGEPQWIIDHALSERREMFLANKRELEARLAKLRDKEAKLKVRYENDEPPRKKKRTESGPQASLASNEEAQFLLDDYESDSETNKVRNSGKFDDTEGLSATTLDLMNKLGMVTKSLPEESLEHTDRLKVFYCSRTHSQLVQFANEVRRVDLTVPQDSTCNGSESKDCTVEGIKYLSLGSRKTLCINSDVRKLGGATAINERCIELQQSKVGKDERCPFLPTKENEPLVHSFRDNVLSEIHDIEDLSTIGKKVGVCPYYASRATIKQSEIVTLPYPLMLQKKAREALGISLKGHVIIIDEAHNIMDAISNIHSSTVTLSHLTRARAQLGIYLQKFRNKLKGKNRVYVTQVVRLIDSLASYLKSTVNPNESADGVAEISDLMAGKGVDQINLNKLAIYLRESKLARKVDGYAAFHDQSNQLSKGGNAAMPVLTHVESFFATLNNPAKEGQFFYSKSEDDEQCLKYQLLDPTFHFRDIVEEARAVILAGGTMSPMEDYMNHLFPYIDPHRLRLLSCGHVIPRENLLAWPVCRGVGGVEFDFTYGKRNQHDMIDALGTSIIQLVSAVPKGTVVFFPSYAYLELVTSRWKLGKPSIWDRISKAKSIFFEGKSSISVEEMLKSYTDKARNGNGALLLSVVGGKLSEGINFSDDLGRGVFIVGLPFPNIRSAEWKAKMNHIEKEAVAKGKSVADGQAEARSFYENTCMRAVNQSIGRAIRHKADYASIFMLDKRYASARIQEKLPGWIKSGLASDPYSKPFSDVVESVKVFFSRDRTQGV